MNDVNVLEVFVGYKGPIRKDKKYAKAERKWNLVRGVLPGCPVPFYIVDFNGIIPIQPGPNRLCYRANNGDDKVKVDSADLGLSGYGTKGENLKDYRVLEFYLEKKDVLAAAGITGKTPVEKVAERWKDFVFQTILDGCTKDPVIVDITLPLYIDMPDGMQPWNTHYLLLTGTKVGKTEIATTVGSVPIATTSVAGLIGSYSFGTGKYIPGKLAGRGVALIDEITRAKPEQDSPSGPGGRNQDDAFGMTEILGYLEQGEVMRGIVGSPICKGTKTVILTGNTDRNILQSVDNTIGKLSGDFYAERVGSRFGLPIFRAPGHMQVVDASGSDASTEPRRERVLALKYGFYHITDLVPSLITSFKPLWTIKDPAFIDEVARTVPLIADKRTRAFWDGYTKSHGDQRLHMLAFRAALVLNMPKIIVLSGSKDALKTILSDKQFQSGIRAATEEYWSKYKSYVLASLYETLDQRMLRAFIANEDGKTQDSIAIENGVTQKTVSIWVNQVRDALLVPGRTTDEVRRLVEDMLAKFSKTNPHGLW